ncbi:uncharacterized protein MONOS_7152 [Monocercomonoides exilis]|uniref:uncharacterized protein n=1 Tax=Monocercomonoides exilis TaxID=2049356 RepID=UPI0035597DE9|nr:hypothetical protein MONOS_7152 [Monocercomonoides exilis]|eukprot:MONOS_7152.1-p1 / transcript=MONOS_7152.1 / gene=MONOS_7152 / organism=Monocercomonoides_exilis_PA203 / gene_product=unspecified product / transcript_product=unspecified product / location=Mono_scaffold00238:20454-21764(-) / protein_length=353 / sequence_SO=supercontig / SO=protein_coding / is_pseudo=false
MPLIPLKQQKHRSSKNTGLSEITFLLDEHLKSQSFHEAIEIELTEENIPFEYIHSPFPNAIVFTKTSNFVLHDKATPIFSSLQEQTSSSSSLFRSSCPTISLEPFLAIWIDTESIISNAFVDPQTQRLKTLKEWYQDVIAFSSVLFPEEDESSSIPSSTSKTPYRAKVPVALLCENIHARHRHKILHEKSTSPISIQSIPSAEADVLKLVTWLELRGCTIFQYSKPEQIGSYLSTLCRSLVTRLHRKQRTIFVQSKGKGKAETKEIWERMLAEIEGVSQNIASAISARYPTFYSLVSALDKAKKAMPQSSSSLVLPISEDEIVSASEDAESKSKQEFPDLLSQIPVGEKGRV